jgi:hypothetical protein
MLIHNIVVTGPLAAPCADTTCQIVQDVDTTEATHRAIALSDAKCYCPCKGSTQVSYPDTAAKVAFTYAHFSTLGSATTHSLLHSFSSLLVAHVSTHSDTMSSHQAPGPATPGITAECCCCDQQLQVDRVPWKETTTGCPQVDPPSRLCGMCTSAAANSTHGCLQTSLQHTTGRWASNH